MAAPSRRPACRSYAVTREGRRFAFPAAIYGPKVMIVNESAGSGGDAMPWYLRKLWLYFWLQGGRPMRFASVAEVKDRLSEYLARARKKNEPIVVTHHGKPYALIQPLSEGDLEELEWKQLARRKLARAWEGEEDALYDYL